MVMGRGVGLGALAGKGFSGVLLVRSSSRTMLIMKLVTICNQVCNKSVIICNQVCNKSVMACNEVSNNL